jgi:parallel beta-helix repeat protein
MQRLLFIVILLLATSAHSATRYVNPAHSGSRDSGSGPSTEPYKTISYAMKQLASGDRLVISAGTYRETMSLRQAASNVIIEGSAGTIVKGSDVVTGWESAGGGRFVRRNWTVNSQQVFVNGVPMKQIGGSINAGYKWPGRVAGNASSMTPDSFYYDGGAKALYVKPASGSLSGTVEASVRERLALGSGLSSVQLRNISFMHSNTSATVRGAAISLHGNKLMVDRINVTLADASGITVNGNENTVQNVVANYCGQLGMSAGGKYNKLINNETSFNNTRGFHPYWEAGGAKFIINGGLQDSEVIGHRAFYNNGDGIWFDSGNPRTKLRNSISAYNQGSGIHFEISTNGTLYNNLVFGNRERGVYLSNSAYTLVAHNLAVGNGLEDISVSNGRKDFAPRSNKVIGNVAAWSAKGALRLPPREYGSTSNGNLFVDDSAPLFFQETSSYATQLVGLPKWQAHNGQDKNSWEKVMAVPSTISSATNARQANVNWSNLKSIASQYRAPSTTMDSGLPPGPLNDMW